ncbi:DM13 domain-containing protein [Vibrio amylolyticus]|uniref:DM13 domain-containing protein n=1 Tax=Vibrio amylolyticus TaxID=2847292 RepID=UPI00354FE61D
MKLRTAFLLVVSHLSVGALGFALGIYALPILIAPDSPTESQVESMSLTAKFTAHFKKDLAGSDSLHWGQGVVSISDEVITLSGTLAPGPDYKLYLSPEFVETEAEVLELKEKMVRVGDVKTFENFIVDLSPDIDPAQYNTVLIWCETFQEFITAVQYQ